MVQLFSLTSFLGLLSKLEKYGIRETELLFFKNYPTGRRQYTVFYDTVSEWLEILCGVLQGSILGPLLFIINDFPNSFNLEITLFADNTTLMKSLHFTPIFFNVKQILYKIVTCTVHIKIYNIRFTRVFNAINIAN